MATTKNATYKVFNGTDWDVIYFKTSAAQVGVSSTRKFITSSTTVNGVNFTLDNSGDGASVTITADNIGLGDNVSGNSFASGDTLLDALLAIDQAAQDAYDHIPNGILTTSNYSDTLGSVYVPRTFTVNDHQLSENGITITSSDIPYADSGWSVEQELYRIANGLHKAWVISYAQTTSVSSCKNALFNSQEATITLPPYQGILPIGYEDVSENLITGNYGLKVGDNIYVLELDVPDRWVSSIDAQGNATLSILETTKVDLTNYATKATTLNGYGITDANIQNGVITLGNNSITPQVQDTSINLYDSQYPDTNYYTSKIIMWHHTGDSDGATTSVGHVSVDDSTSSYNCLEVTSSNNASNMATGVAFWNYAIVAPAYNRNSAGVDISYNEARVFKLPQKNAGSYTLVTTDDMVVVQVGTSFSGTPATGNIWIDTAA